MNLNKKNKKLQPYVDFWVSDTETDFSCPACVPLCCLSVPSCLLCLFLSRSRCCQSNTNRQLFPSLSPYAMFSTFGNVDVLLVDTVHEC